MTNRLWAIAAVSAGLAGIGAMPAVAADPLLFSLDGEEWATELTNPIFGDTPVLVPGDEASASFWVRNASADAADLKVALAGDWPTTGGDTDGLWVRAALDGAAGASSGDTVLLALGTMDALDSRKVTVTVGIDAAAGNSNQNVNLPMAFDVRLTQSIPQAPIPGDGDGVVPPANPVSPTPGTESDVPAQPNVPAAPGQSEEQPQARPGEPFGTLPDAGFTALWTALAGAALTAGGFLAVAYSLMRKNTSEEGGHGPA